MAKLTSTQQQKDDPASLPTLGRRFLWADNSAAVSLAIKILMALCLVLFLLDFVIHRKSHFSLEAMYGFYAIAGFVAFTFIVIAAKVLRMIIGRDETYYSPHAVDGESYPEEGLDRQEHAAQTEDQTEAKS